MKIGNKILELRKLKHFSQDQLAEKIGVTRQTISNWELGETVPNSEQLLLLSKVLDTSLDELMNNKIDMQNKKNNGVFIVLIGIILILSALLVFVIISNNDDEDYIKLYKTTNNINTTTSQTSPANLKDTFIRTYEILELEKVICDGEIFGCYDSSYNVTLRQYNGENQKLQLTFIGIDNIDELEINKNYEFEFRSMGEKYFDDNMINIFANCMIISIKETNKVGEEQIQDNIKY